MKTRQIIKIHSQFTENREYKPYITIDAYQLRNGLAVGHLLKRDADGDYKYTPGWVIYHVKTGAIAIQPDKTIKQPQLKTPAEAMKALRKKCKGKALSMLKTAAGKLPDAVMNPDSPVILSKLRAWPKPTEPLGSLPPGCERVKVLGNSALFALLADIDAAGASASQKGNSFVTFRFGRATYKILHRFENIKRFRANVLKKRHAFNDKNIQHGPKLKKPVATVTPAVTAWVESFKAASVIPTEAPKRSKAAKVSTTAAKRPKRVYTDATWTPPMPDEITTRFSLRANMDEVKKRKPPGFMQWLSDASARFYQLQA